MWWQKMNDSSYNKWRLQISEKEYKTWHDEVGKGIHRILCKKFKFDYRNRENEILKYKLTEILKYKRTTSNQSEDQT